MMTGEERIQSLKELGYTQREAEFLCLAALYSGYFVRRQYCQFIAMTAGRPEHGLARKVLSKGHAREIATNRRTLLYHLSSRSFYASLGQADNRNRRRHPRFAIRARLMALDYVIANSGHRYLATESEKIDYFNSKLGIGLECLPRKVYRSTDNQTAADRYFVEKFPISIPANGHTSSGAVTFCYIDEGEIATPAFGTYLIQYSLLFSALKRFRIVFVAIKEQRLIVAGKTFERHFRHSVCGEPASQGVSTERLLSWMRLEHLLRNERYDLLNMANLDQLRTLRKDFQESNYADLIDLWRRQGERAVREKLSQDEVAKADLKPEFVPCLLTNYYDFLETARPRTREREP